MKKTIIVNINGIVFNIDEDAYEMLEVYLNRLKHYFNNNPEGPEIIDDIEGRIVELLQPKISPSKQSISLEDVAEMIEILGRPEDIADAGDEPNSKDTSRPKDEVHKARSRLYRDPDHAILGGVCSGLGAYFNLDPVFFRIVSIGLIFAGGVSFILYPILWIAVPKAQTAAQKLEMRGQSVTVENIERTFREEYEQVKDNLHRMNSNSFWEKFRNFLNELMSLFHSFFRVLWSILRYLFGLFLIVISMLLIISMISTFYFNTFFVDHVSFENFLSLNDYLNHIISPASANLLLLLASILIVLPLAGLIYAGLKLIIRFKAKDKLVILGLFIVWILTVIVFVSVLFNEIGKFKKYSNTHEIVTISKPKNNTLYLNAIFSSDANKEQLDRISNSDFSIGLDKVIFGRVRIEIEKGLSSVPEMEIVRMARGASSDEALTDAKAIKIAYNQTDSVFNINPAFLLGKDQRWKLQEAKIIIRIPVGMKIFLNENLRNFLYDIQNSDNYYHRDMVDKTWLMTENGLELLRSSKVENFEIKTPQNNVLYIQKRDRLTVSEDQLYRNDFGHIKSNGKMYNFRVINVDIKVNESNNIKLEVEKKTAWAYNYNDNYINQAITYSFEQKDSVLWLDPVFLFPQNMKQNDQEVNVVLYLPIKSKVFFTEELKPLLRRYADRHGKSDDEYVNKFLEMTLGGLREIEEKKDVNE